MPTKPWISFSYENPLKKRLDESFFERLPINSGVYLMLDARDSILYVGKAKNLRKRLQTYRNAKPGQVPEHTIEMLDRVSKIVYEEQPSEAQALTREYELIRTIRPPFNIAGLEPDLDLYIAVKMENDQLHLRLSSYGEADEGFSIFGSYIHRRKAKAAYGALLRVVFASTTTKARFSFPAKIARVAPAYAYSIRFFPELEKDLKLFLKGKNDRLLRRLVEKLLLNEFVPPFVRPGLQKDLQTMREFYDSIRGIELPSVLEGNRF